MTYTLKLVVAMAVVTWLTILLAPIVRFKSWTAAGRNAAFGSRDTVAEIPSVFAGRVERTAKNTLENFILFAVLALVAHAANLDQRVQLGAEIFFWARIVYIPIYYAGISFGYVRTLVYIVSLAGLGRMVMALIG